MFDLAVRRAPTALLVVLAVAAFSLGSAVATHRLAFVETHGISMNPVYFQGDLVAVTRADSYEVGQIVAYHATNVSHLVLHRIIGGDAGGFVMQGDNNQSIDPFRPTAEQIAGRAVLRLPQGGAWLERITNPASIAMLALLLTVAGGSTIHTRTRRRRAAMSSHAHRIARRATSLVACSPALQAAAAAVAVVGIIGVAGGAVAWTASPDKPATVTSERTRAMTFSYDAAVAPSAAYDDTTVRSPDPVFRRLTDTVSLHLAYEGRPGVITVVAELSTPGGWHSAILLAESTPIAAGSFDTTVILDVAAFQARAEAAAAVTGLPASPVTIEIMPTVQPTDDIAFSPTLELTLTPLQLALAGDEASLIVEDSISVSEPTNVSRTLELLGWQTAVSRARIVSAVLLVGAMLAAAVLALIATRAAQVSEGSRIRRRYAPLLAVVSPMTTPMSQPVVEVAQFETLIRLAERGGLLVLHWSRADIDTFLVCEVHTTYRYRTGVGKRGAFPPPATERYTAIVPNTSDERGRTPQAVPD